MEAKDMDVAIGAEIRARRKVAGMSLEKLGAAVGVTYQQIQKYETGANRVSASTLIKLGDVLPGGLPAIVAAATGTCAGAPALADVGDQMALDRIVDQLRAMAPDARRVMLAGFSGIVAGATMGRAV